MDYLEPFYQPRNEQELAQQPLAPNQWANTTAAMRQLTDLLLVRRDELTAYEARVQVMCRKNNLGNVTKMFPRQMAMAAVVAGLEQMQAEIGFRMQVLTNHVERHLQALQLHYEEIEAQSNRLFAHPRTGEAMASAIGHLQKSFTQVEAVRDLLLELGYPFDESAYRASCVKLRQAVSLPSSTQLQLMPQVQDWLTQHAPDNAEGEVIEFTIQPPENINLDALLGDNSS
jgi:hypothetical protein